MIKMTVSQPGIKMKIEPAKVVYQGGGGGTTDHRELTNRDADDQHPIKAITGLQSKLDTIPPAAEKITNTEIEEMLK